MENPIEKKDDLGGKPLLLETPQNDHFLVGKTQKLSGKPTIFGNTLYIPWTTPEAFLWFAQKWVTWQFSVSSDPSDKISSSSPGKSSAFSQQVHTNPTKKGWESKKGFQKGKLKTVCKWWWDEGMNMNFVFLMVFDDIFFCFRKKICIPKKNQSNQDKTSLPRNGQKMKNKQRKPQKPEHVFFLRISSVIKPQGI